jgi:hypothetical protein
MIYSRQMWTFMAAMAFIYTLMLSFSTPAHAASISCSKIISGARTSRQTPKVIIDTWKGILTIKGSYDTCKGPLEVWGDRRIANYQTTRMSSKSNRTAPQVKLSAKLLLLRLKQRQSKPLVKSSVTDQGEIIVVGPLHTRCEIELRDVWKGGLYEIRNTSYYLGRIFTIDNNHDGITDNVGFVFQRSRQPELKAYHNQLAGNLHISAVKGLQALKFSEIASICFGQVKFSVPEEKLRAKKKSKPAQAFIIPDITQEIKDKVADNPTAEEIIATKKAQVETNIPLWMWILIVKVIFIIFGVILFSSARKGKITFLRRMKKRSQRDFDPYPTATAKKDYEEVD